jgi:hypothetical protein
MSGQKETKHVDGKQNERPFASFTPPANSETCAMSKIPHL